MKKFISILSAVLMSVYAMANTNKNESVTEHLYTITIYAPEGLEPAFVGLGNASTLHSSMIPNIDTKGNLYYYAKVTASEGTALKFVANADKNAQIKCYDQSNQCWMDLDHITLGNKTEVVYNYSDSGLYMWSSVLQDTQYVEFEYQASR